MIQNWTEKYRAEEFDKIKGQNEAINEIKLFIRYFPNIKKALLLHGPPGVGKTSLAYAMKKELGFEIFELNASDFRNKEQLEAKLKPASEQASLFSKGKILLVDEVDGLTSEDKGGLSELLELIDTTQFPMIITANNVWDAKFGNLRKKCKIVSLKEVDYKDILSILQKISKEEKKDIDNQIMLSISIKSKGDVRAAINDLQVVSSDDTYQKNYLSLDERNKEIDIFNALKLVFKDIVREETLWIYDKVDIPLDKIFLWIEENIPYEYSGEELFNAYEVLSIADVFRGRIQRQRHWRFIIYENILLSAGISASKKKQKTGFTKYQKPSRILKIWMSNEHNKNKYTIISKFAKATHCSKRKAMKEFHLIKYILKNKEIQRKLDLIEHENSYINKIK
ncbi:MAG: replication factor C large subunit [Candidatus Pacearchaeota archaeon]